jgi:demethylmenaquinone methyltransferase/2-methoxy-6-polyprenyl-1,4-benzoquinol methylase
MDDTELLARQQAYYRARAPEYDEWFYRQGRYDKGADVNDRWLAEIESVREALASHAPYGHVLELACGTGLWTERLAPHAASFTAIDVSPEMLARAEARVRNKGVTFVQADIFQWTPARAYDFVFFGFWLSHVPPVRFDAFWQLVRAALAPGGHVFFVDSCLSQESAARNHDLSRRGAYTVTRKLNDGSAYDIVKVFYEPASLTKSLEKRGWEVHIRSTVSFFLYGTGYLRS